MVFSVLYIKNYFNHRTNAVALTIAPSGSSTEFPCSAPCSRTQSHLSQCTQGTFYAAHSKQLLAEHSMHGKQRTHRTDCNALSVIRITWQELRWALWMVPK